MRMSTSAGGLTQMSADAAYGGLFQAPGRGGARGRDADAEDSMTVLDFTIGGRTPARGVGGPRAGADWLLAT